MRLASVEQIFKSFEDHGVRYLIVGGLAVALHGYSRATSDIDLVIQLAPDNIRSTFLALGKLGFRPTVPVTELQFADRAIRERLAVEKGMQVLNLHSPSHPETTVDLFVAEPFDFDAEYDLAYIQELIPGVPLRVARLDLLLDMKRRAGRPLDLVDIEELGRIRKALDE